MTYMQDININPEILSKIKSIFIRVAEEFTNIDNSIISSLTNVVAEVTHQLKALESRHSEAMYRLKELEFENTSLRGSLQSLYTEINCIGYVYLNDFDRKEKEYKRNMLNIEINQTKLKISSSESKISDAKQELAKLRNAIEDKKRELYYLTQKLQNIRTNSSINSMRSADLKEEVAKKLMKIEVDLEKYNSVSLPSVELQSNLFQTQQPQSSQTSLQQEIQIFELQREEYAIGELLFALKQERNKITVSTVPEAVAFEMKHRASTLSVIYKEKVLPQRYTDAYFAFLDVFAREHGFSKALVWVERDMQKYEDNGFTYEGMKKKSGTEMFKEYK